MNKPINNIVICGSSYAAYLSALFLKNKLGASQVSLTVIDTPSAEVNHLVISSPELRQLHSELKISEPAFVKQTRAEMNLGVELSNFPVQNQPGFFSFSPYGLNFGNRRFQFLYRKYLESNKEIAFDHFSINARMARGFKFTPPSPKSNSVFADVDYGYRLQGVAYKEFLKALTISSNISIKPGEISSVIKDSDGQIEALTLNNGDKITGDFFIDCCNNRPFSQTENLAEAGTKNCYPFDIFSERLDQQQDNTGLTQSPYHQINAIPNGLSLSSNTNKQTISQQHIIQSKSGSSANYFYTPQPWRKNFVALGDAFISKPDLILGSIDLLQISLKLLVQLWPRSTTSQSERDCYNRKILAQTTSTLHLDQFILAESSNNNALIPEAVAQKLSTFKYNGTISKSENDCLNEQQWTALFYALGYRPQFINTGVIDYDSQQLDSELAQLSAVLDKAVPSAPDYSVFLKKVHGTHG